MFDRRSDAAGTKRKKLAQSPSLATLEDRRMLTAGVSTLAAPALAVAVDRSASNAVVTDAVTISAPADGLSISHGSEWVYSGSDALLGPVASVAYSSQATALGGSSAAFPGRPGEVFEAQVLPAFHAVGEMRTLPAFDVGWQPEVTPEQAELNAAFQKQSENRQAIEDKSEITPRLMATLRKAREAVDAKAGEADASLVQTLHAKIQSVHESGTFTEAQRQDLQNAYTAVLQSAGVSQGAIAGLFGALDAVYAASNVTADDLKTLAADQAEVQRLLDAQPVHLSFGEFGEIAYASRGSLLPASDLAVTSMPLGAPATDPNGVPLDPADLAAYSAPVAIISTTSGGEKVVPISAPIGGAGGIDRRLPVRPTPGNLQRPMLERLSQNGGLNLIRGGMVRRPVVNVGTNGEGRTNTPPVRTNTPNSLSVIRTARLRQLDIGAMRTDGGRIGF